MEELRKEIYTIQRLLFSKKADFPNNPSAVTDRIMQVIATHEKQLLARVGKEVLGGPLQDDITWKPTLKDPYGVNQMKGVSVQKTKVNVGSYETIRRQYRRLSELTKSIERGE